MDHALLVGEGYRLEGSTSLPFHTSVFLEQFVYQFFQPLSVPLVILFRGKNAVTNLKLFWFSTKNMLSFVISLFGLLFPVATMMIVILWIILRITSSRTDTPSNTATSNTDGGGGWILHETPAFLRSVDFEVAIVFAITVFHRSIIALKYAYLPSMDYENIMTNIEDETVLSEDQLLSGWTNLNGRLIMKEVRLSATRLGVAAENVRIDLNNRQYQELVHSISPCALSYLTTTGEIREDVQGLPVEATISTTDNKKSTKDSITNTNPRYPPHRIVPENNNGNILPQTKDNKNVPITVNVPSNDDRVYKDTAMDNNDDDESVMSPVTTAPIHIHQHNRMTHPPVMPLSPYNNAKPDLAFLHSSSLSEKRTVSISVLALCAATLSHANNLTIGNLRYLLALSIIVASVIALIPLAVRSWVGLSTIGSTSLTQFIAVSCALLNIWFLSLLLFYLQTGVLDYRRRRLAIHHLGTLATRRFRSPYDNDDNTMDSPPVDTKPSPQSSSSTTETTNSSGNNDTVIAAEDTQETNRALQEVQRAYHRSRRVSISIRNIIVDNYSKNASSISSSSPAATPSSSSSTLSLIPPVISLDSVSNIRAWLTAREIIRGVGLRYFRRITIIASVSLLCAIILTIIGMARLVLEPDAKSNLFNIQQGGVADLIMAIDVIAFLTAVGVYLFVMLMDGARTNITTIRQCSLLIGRQTEAITAQSLYETKASQLRLTLLRTPLDDPSRTQMTHDIEQYSFAAQQWKHTATMLGIAKSKLQYDEPITLLGINCSYTFAQTVAYAVITSQGVVIKLINDKYSFIALPSWLTK